MATAGYNLEPVLLGDRELAQISALVRTKAGITLTPAKRPLIIARLQKRKLQLKDEIVKIEGLMIPDIIA